MTMNALVLALALLCQADRAAVEKKVLERINFHRKLVGLDPVTMDPELSKGCQLHAEYILKNHGTDGSGGHEEDPAKPGYTKEGEEAGRSSLIDYSDPTKSVDVFMGTFFHRVPLLMARLKKVGLGYVKQNGEFVVVLDARRGREGDKEPEALCYPVDKQREVPTTLEKEWPNPTPSAEKAGYPITVTFGLDLQVTDVKAVLKDGNGKVVEAWVSTPEKPADEKYQRNTVCLIAKKPLKSKTAYVVEVEAKVNDKEWKKKWAFVTK